MIIGGPLKIKNFEKFLIKKVTLGLVNQARGPSTAASQARRPKYGENENFSLSF